MATSWLSTKQRALDDARRAHSAALALCRASSQPPPPYRLTELVGKGSFGRVYKAVCSSSSSSASPGPDGGSSPTTILSPGTVVAVKVIDIERGDAVAPGLADTLADLRAELRTLHALRGARNVNHVLDALLVGPAVWLVVEHCAGGSVATLLRPLRDRGTGLREKWAVPILRETAAALAWVHAQGVIHRDVKTANVLVAEDGRGVQLCDFGVAATLRCAAEKRTTVVGTPHAMAPELLTGSNINGGCRYGTEVDVWAFGALAYELATGRPPNAALGAGLARLGRQLQMETPRLVGARYADGLKDLVACCLRREPAARPTMEEVCCHAYISSDTELRFPTVSLAQLVRAFRVWEAQGGDRRSLFAEGGAPGMGDEEGEGVEDVVHDWNFSTAVDADVDDVLHASDHEALSGAYGTDAEKEEPAAREEATPRRRRRRPPPRQMALKSPLEKVFDANTLSNYDDYSRQYYAKFLPAPVQQALLHSDLPAADRDSLIDLDLCLVDENNISGSSSGGGDSSAFNSVDLGVGTMRPVTSGSEEEEEHDFAGGTKRATQDWKFPFMVSQPATEDASFSPLRWDEGAAASDASHSRSESLDSLIDLDMSAAPPTSVIHHRVDQKPRLQEPPLPLAPLPQVLMGQAGDEQVKEELHRMTASLAEHLRYATMYLADLPISRGQEGFQDHGATVLQASPYTHHKKDVDSEYPKQFW